MKKNLISIILVLFTVTYYFSLNVFAIDSGKYREPLSVLLLGIDTGTFGRTDYGRSDVIILLTINSEKEKITLTSIPRDSYVNIIGLNRMDKINHAYAYGGVEMTMKTINDLFGIEIDYFVTIDMEGLKEGINLLGGVEVTPPSTFDIDGYTFFEDIPIKLDGDMALAYVRERFTSGGDYARQNRQRDLIVSIIEKYGTNNSYSNLKEIYFSAIRYINTNINYFYLLDILKDFRETNFDIEEFQLGGTAENFDGVYYEILNEETLNEIKLNIQKELER